MMAAFDPTAELLGHDLLAVADAEKRDAGRVERRRRQRRAAIEHRSRAAGEDDALGLHRRKCAFGIAERNDFRIDPLLAHAPGDELGHLRPENDDEDLVVQDLVIHRGAARCRLPPRTILTALRPCAGYGNRPQRSLGAALCSATTA